MQGNAAEDRIYSLDSASLWDKKYGEKVARRLVPDGGFSVSEYIEKGNAILCVI